MSKKYFRKNDDIKHIIIFGKQGKGKDLFAVSYLADHINKRKVYSNSPLKFPYYGVHSIRDIELARDGYLYLHDMDLIFNSRDFILKRNQDKQEGLLEIVNNMRKHGLSLIGTCHRQKSIDVKVRSLINYWIQTDLVLIGDDDTNMYDYVIKFDVWDEYGNFIYSGTVSNLPKYAVMYDTDDCVKPLE